MSTELPENTAEEAYWDVLAACEKLIMDRDWRSKSFEINDDVILQGDGTCFYLNDAVMWTISTTPYYMPYDEDGIQWRNVYTMARVPDDIVSEAIDMVSKGWKEE